MYNHIYALSQEINYYYHPILCVNKNNFKSTLKKKKN